MEAKSCHNPKAIISQSKHRHSEIKSLNAVQQWPRVPHTLRYHTTNQVIIWAHTYQPPYPYKSSDGISSDLSSVYRHCVR